MMKADIQNTKKETQVSIIKEKHSRYTPPTNQGWEEKEERSTDDNSFLKHKIKKSQISIIKEEYSRYTLSIYQVWEEKEEGGNDESSHSKHKLKENSFQSSKKNLQSTHQPLIRVGRRKKRGVLMIAAF